MRGLSVLMAVALGWSGEWAEAKGGRGGYSSGGRGAGGYGVYSPRRSYNMASVSRTPRVSAFIGGAAVGYLAGRSMGYYYAPYGFSAGYGTYGRRRYWEREKNVCSFKVVKNKVLTGNSSSAPAIAETNATAFDDTGSFVTLYFLCDGQCCEKDCCDVDGGQVALIVILSLLGVGLVICGCCWLCAKLKSPGGSLLTRDPAAAQRGAGAARQNVPFTPMGSSSAYPTAPQAAPYAPPQGSSAAPPPYAQAVYTAPADIGFKA